ncbi:F-box protein-like protein [Tanacetum coccineum]
MEHQHSLKRIKIKQEEDQISDLQECLLLEIISRLPTTKDAIKTGTLSKRWQHLWPYVPDLIFHYDSFDCTYSLNDFVSYVEKALTQCRQLKLNKFHLNTSYDITFQSHVTNWIRYAVKRNVEHLELSLWTTEVENVFVLDEFFFTNLYFTRLKLSCCEFSTTGAVSWRNLKSLCITRGKLNEGLVQNILSGSPVLETLELRDCYGFRRMDITSKSVKNLVLCGFSNLGDEIVDVIEINAPSILALTIQRSLLLWKVVLLNVSSLVEANLDYTKDGIFVTSPKDEEEELLKGLILSLCHVKEIKLGIFCSKVLSRLEAKGFTVPSNMKYLDILPAVYSYNRSIGNRDCVK